MRITELEETDLRALIVIHANALADVGNTASRDTLLTKAKRIVEFIEQLYATKL